jgi:heme-degrading monooxygenase HmoA
MLARVVTIQVRPEKMDECIAIFKDTNAPSIAAQPGFDQRALVREPCERRGHLRYLLGKRG